MSPKSIPHIKGDWLSKSLKVEGYENIPSNVILNKTLPGLGATYMEIIAERHSIIIEPNVPVITGKKKEHKNTLGIYKMITPRSIVKYLLNNKIEYKKLLTTPEGFWKIKDAFENEDVKLNLYEDFFCLFDECEKIIQDHDYRDTISNPIYDFFEFKEKAFVSATPIIPSDPKFKKQGFRTLKIEPKYSYKKNLNLVVTNDFDRVVIEQLTEKSTTSECICVFLNETNAIIRLIKSLNIEDQSKVFCSNKSVSKAKEKLVHNSYESVDLPLAKFNFFTCRFYSAVDIKLGDIKPDVFILTNNNLDYTSVDPHTQAIQIYGRFRNGIESLTHISTTKEQEIRSTEVINGGIKAHKRYYDLIKSNPIYGFHDNVIQAYTRTLQSLPYTKYLYANGTINYFAIDNEHYDEKIKSYYLSSNHLHQAYLDTKHFNVKFQEYFTETPSPIFTLNEISIKERRKELVQWLEATKESTSMESALSIFRAEFGDFLEMYFKLGKEQIEKRKYNITTLKKDLLKHKIEEHRLSQDIFCQVHNHFKLQIGKPISKNTIKEELQKIYDRNGIEFKVSQTTIKDYYNITSSNSATPPTHTLKIEKTFGDEN